jgi:hypothetical protein
MPKSDGQHIHDCQRDEPPRNWTHEVACLIHQYDTLEKCPKDCRWLKGKENEATDVVG